MYTIHVSLSLIQNKAKSESEQRRYKMKDRTHIDQIRIEAYDRLMFNKTVKEQYNRTELPNIWYNFNFGDTTIQIRKGRKGFYIASRRIQDLSLLKEEITVQSAGNFFKSKEGNFIETCIKWQKCVKSVLSRKEAEVPE